MRLRGSIEEDVHWTEPALECTGMSRPDGRGLRVRFAGALAGGELAVVFAAPELGVGASGHGVPVNVTLLDGAGERIYGTQGDSRCQFDEVEQQPLEDGALPRAQLPHQRPRLLRRAGARPGRRRLRAPDALRFRGARLIARG